MRLRCGLRGLAAFLPFALASCALPERADYELFAPPYLSTSPIVGGVAAKPDALPWQVSIQLKDAADPLDGHICGGVVYSKRWILTAAHCVDGRGATTLAVSAGATRLEPGISRIAVDRVEIYRPLSGSLYDGDLALVRLAKPLRLGRAIRAIPLDDGAFDEPIFATFSPATRLLVSGWGATAEGGTPTRTLMMVDVAYVGNDVCNAPEAYDGIVTEALLCAGYRDGGKDSCTWDSGGPLVEGAFSRRPRLVGIVSRGEGCARPGKYGIYTRVSLFRDWIEKTAI